MKTGLLLLCFFVGMPMLFAQPNPTWQVIFQTQDGVFTESCSGGAPLDNHHIAYVYIDRNEDGPDSTDVVPQCVLVSGMGCFPEANRYTYRNFALEADGTINSPVFQGWLERSPPRDSLHVFLRIFLGNNSDSCFVSPVVVVPRDGDQHVAVIPRADWACAASDVIPWECYGSHYSIELFWQGAAITNCIEVCPQGTVDIWAWYYPSRFRPPLVQLTAGCDTACEAIRGIHFNAYTWRSPSSSNIWQAYIVGQDAGCVTVSLIDQIPTGTLDTMTAVRSESRAELTWNTTWESTLALFEIWNIWGQYGINRRLVATVSALNTSGGSEYTARDDSVSFYYNSAGYLLVMVGDDGQEYAAAYVDQFGVLASEPEPQSIARDYFLSVFPNPFNPSTTLSFSLPRAGEVKMAVYDVTGRLADGQVRAMSLQAGEHHFTFDGAGLASGIYFARLESAGLVKTQKLLLLK